MSLIIAVDMDGTHICVAAFKPDQTTPIRHQHISSQGLKSGGSDRLVITRAALRIALTRLSEEDPP